MPTWDLSLEGDKDGLPLLRRFLLQQHERPRAYLAKSTPEPNQLGTALEVLRIITAEPSIILTIPVTIAIWIKSRQKKIRLTIVRPDGSKVTVDASGSLAENALKELIETAMIPRDTEPQEKTAPNPSSRGAEHRTDLPNGSNASEDGE